MELRFLSFGSSSSGNCYYIGTSEYGILIDAGVAVRTVKKALKDNGIALEKIMAVFITHDHSDHIKSAGSLGEQHGIPIYATEEVHKGIFYNPLVTTKLQTSRRVLEKEQPVVIRDLQITAFDVPHDARDCVGYCVKYQNRNLVLATDVGHISDTVASYIRIANHLIIETNYDREMLHSGKYPKYLQARIEKDTGHLSNDETADFLAANFDLHLKNIWLCHLSKENNHPDLAYKTVETAFGRYGIRIGKDVRLVALKRTGASEMFVLE
ncbi:MAG: MBL fold metallo-hydrolase [Candidatus Symbiothrix sp.]|jgi:phosphoribosyl 1,2-cyclic phosphodiesterase|nr:MBL fold metallo-hydrolase [Candidatus Symbiothrix sp.]